MLEDFIMKEIPLFHFVGRALDYKRIIALPDRDFSQLYLELMSEYRDKDGWWGAAGIPKCSSCHEEIPGPDQLRRYHGRSMYPSCFRHYYAREGDGEDMVGIMRQYWLRVADLDRVI
jgi:hypothetical protein